MQNVFFFAQTISKRNSETFQKSKVGRFYAKPCCVKQNQKLTFIGPGKMRIYFFENKNLVLGDLASFLWVPFSFYFAQ